MNALLHLLSWKEISIIIIILSANDCGIGKIVYICSGKYSFNMSYTEKIVVKNPSRELEEKVREIGALKYLWLKKLCSDETKPDTIIYVR